MAEHGANERQIMSFLAHKSTCKALTWIRDANPKMMAEAGLALVHSKTLCNLPEQLGKKPPQTSERNGAMVTPAGFEPATCPLGGGCSIQLSHGAFGAFLAALGGDVIGGSHGQGGKSDMASDGCGGRGACGLGKARYPA